MNIKNWLRSLLIISAIFIGLYPLIVLGLGLDFSLFNIKSEAVLSSLLWNIAFYVHTSLGGIALLIGWTGFIKKLRSRNIQTHRILGKIYVVTAILSAIAGIYIGFFSNGGLLAATGFVSMGIVWLYTTIKAYQFIRAGNIIAHEKMMLYSYTACFTGVTFRIWAPMFVILLNDFDTAYSLMAWWSWISNIGIAYFLIKKKERALSKDSVNNNLPI